MSFSTIGDHVELQRGTTYKSALLEQPGPLLLGLGSIERDGGFRSKKLKTYGGPSPEKLLVYPGDLYVSLKDVTQSGDLLGSIARVPENVVVGRMTQDTVKLCFKTDISKNYFYWLLRTPQYRQHCRSHATGTTNLGLSRDDFFAFIIPELTDTREKITNILERIEQKITLNRQTNQTLEQTAQAIFKSWFVDYEPVKAKAKVRASVAEGKLPGSDQSLPKYFDVEAAVELAAMCAISGKTEEQLKGVNETTLQQLKTAAALFPDSLVESELGEIPEEWSIKALDEIAYYQNGLALQKFRPENESDFLPVLKISQLKKGFADGKEKATPNIKPECIVDNGDVVFSWSGSLIVDVWCGGRAALNQHLFKVTSDNYPKWFYYYWTKRHLESFQQIAADKAVTMGHIKREHLSQAKCLIPSGSFGDFDMLVGLLEKQIEQRIESFTLQEIRDALLPKLLSGEMNFNEPHSKTEVAA